MYCDRNICTGVNWEKGRSGVSGHSTTGDTHRPSFATDKLGSYNINVMNSYIYNLSFYTGGPSIQVVLLYRWSFYTGGPSIQVVLLYRWSFYTGGPSIQVVLLYRGSFYTGGPSIQVVLLYRWYKHTLKLAGDGLGQLKSCCEKFCDRV